MKRAYIKTTFEYIYISLSTFAKSICRNPDLSTNQRISRTYQQKPKRKQGFGSELPWKLSADAFEGFEIAFFRPNLFSGIDEKKKKKRNSETHTLQIRVFNQTQLISGVVQLRSVNKTAKGRNLTKDAFEIRSNKNLIILKITLTTNPKKIEFY